MLDINTDTICRLIALAMEFHAQEGVVIPDDMNNPGDDWARQVLAAHAGDESFREFRSIVSDLGPDQQHQLVALMWLGRDDYSLDEWDDAVNYAAESATPATAEYLIAHPMLADDLTEGLLIFGFDCNDIV